ncbi:putative ATPase (AAA+ superfamily) [Rhizobium sp. CF122]|uniref:ATP-binding protein n=1 Tax=Rhizobium sp. CF122 TaxID=1144312 RepID=UPI00027164EF|nr:ATP-binding protein [Rhizobium sp. CF122]EJL49783.1 putative ATPase (AAA+ superfamily) [Rhizobium sp. CF122]
MNKILYQRHLKSELNEALENARVINLIGPRQVGKTTLVRDMLEHGVFATLDDDNVLQALETEAQGQVQLLFDRAAGRPVVIDEVQRSKQIALAIKRIVDTNRQMGQFILTGSSNIFVSADVMDSLAGRVQTLRMLPLSSAEIGSSGPCRLLDWAKESGEVKALPECVSVSREETIDRIIRGGFPEIRPLAERPRQRRYREYVDAIVDKDVADVTKIRRPDSMRRLINQLATRTSNELNTVELGEKVGIQRQTVSEYLDILERLSIVYRLPAWTSGEAGRDVRHPKYHLIDTGVAAALRGITADDYTLGKDQTSLGSLFENYILTELLKSLPLQRQEWRLFHWRDRNGPEIDILAENGNLLVGFEMKASSAVSFSDFKNFQTFKNGPGKNWDVIGLVIYTGDQILVFGDKLFALPASIFQSFPVR